MQVVIQPISSTSRFQKIQLRANQIAQFGRSGWADFSFLDDAEMSEVHFEVRCARDGCWLRNLSTNGKTLLNGEQIDSARLRNGDEIVAGSTSFQVALEGDGTQQDDPGESEVDSTSEATAAISLVAVCAYLDLSAEIQQAARQVESVEVLITQLVQQDHVLDALRLRAYLLPKREAVWWGCSCVRDMLLDELPAEQVVALQASVNWVMEPAEPQRRDAEEKANSVHFNGPGGLLAVSAFWSGGSIAPPGSPEVHPDPRLTCQGVAAALITAIYYGDATKADDRIAAFMEKGKSIAEGKVALPEGSVVVDGSSAFDPAPAS